MSPLEAWYARITDDVVIARLGDSNLEKRVRQRIDKAQATRACDLDYPKLAEMVGGQIRIKDQHRSSFIRR